MTFPFFFLFFILWKIPRGIDRIIIWDNLASEGKDQSLLLTDELVHFHGSVFHSFFFFIICF